MHAETLGTIPVRSAHAFAAAWAATVLCLWIAPATSEAGYGGMAIEAVQDDKERIRITTTGAEFLLDKARGTIECFQRIPQGRQVGVVSGLTLADMKVEYSSNGECRLTADGGRCSMSIGTDSLLRMRFTASGLVVTVTGAYEPQHRSRADNHFFLPDEQGGLGTYLFGRATCQTPAEWKPPWALQYGLAGPGELWVSVFPPRPFDWQASCETMLHSFSWKHPYPSDEELQEWRKYGSVLTLHSWIWKGNTDQYVEKDDSWTQRTFRPKSEHELRRVTRTAHELKMKVIAYMSPYYQSDATSAGIDEFVVKVRNAIQDYGLDGVYFDGTFRDIRAAYEVTRKTRQAIGQEGVLHIHSTGIPPIRCPFMDTHANYMLVGEHRGLNKDDARWNVSGYNLSNSIGTFCYDAARVNQAMIDTMLSVHARLPVWVGDGSWNGAAYHLKPPEMQLMVREYLPKLDQVRKIRAVSSP